MGTPRDAPASERSRATRSIAGVKSDTSMEAAEENLRMSRRQYEAGLETLSDYLEAQAVWQQASRTQVEARIGSYLRWLEYRKAAGLLD